MKTADFILEHLACPASAKWALSISEDMADVWDALIAQDKHDWLLWAATRPGVLPAPALRRLACRFVRETPMSDGRNVWDLLTDERSRKAVEVAEAYAEGKATADELSAAYDSARDASVDSCDSAADAAADAAASATGSARSAAHAAYAAWAAARAAEASAASEACASAYAACAAGDAAAYYAVDADAWRAACAAAKSAQVKMVAELGNPFNRKE